MHRIAARTSTCLLLLLIVFPIWRNPGVSHMSASQRNDSQSTSEPTQIMHIPTPIHTTDSIQAEAITPEISSLMEPSANGRTATTAKYLTLTGDCIKIGVKAEGSFGNGNQTPALQYNKACNGSFDENFEYIASNAALNCRFEAIAVSVNGTLYADSNNAYDIVNSGKCDVSLFESYAGYTSLVDSASIVDKSGQIYRGTRWNNRLVTFGTKRGKYKIENDIRFNKADKFIEITTTITPSVTINDLYVARVADIDLLQVTGDDWSSFTGRGYSTLDAKFLVMVESNVSKQIAGFYTGDTTTIGSGIASQTTWDPTPNRFFNTGISGYTDSLIGITKRFTNARAGVPVSFRYAYVFGESAYSTVSSAVSKGIAGGTPGKVPGCPTCKIVDTGSIGPADPPYDSGNIELCSTNCGFESGNTSTWDASASFTVSGAFVRSGSYAVEKTTATSATLTKTISLTDARQHNAIDKGTATYIFNAYLDPGDSEKGNVELLFFNAAGASIGSWDSGSIRNSHEEWTRSTNSGAFPRSTRSVVIRFTASRTSGSNTDLNIDDVSLQARFQYTPPTSTPTRPATRTRTPTPRR